jgi:hypothetical protein
MPDPKDRSRQKQDLHDTEIKRETNIRNSMGEATPGTDEGKVTAESDVFKELEHPEDRK